MQKNDQRAQAQQALDGGQISQAQFDQIKQIDDGVDQSVQQDDAGNRGRALIQDNFAEIYSQLDASAALVAPSAALV